MRHLVVNGDPAAQGSKRLIRTRRGRTVMLEQSRKVHPWRSVVAAEARRIGGRMMDGDIAMVVQFRFVRPRSHFKKDGLLRSSAPARPGYADCDKLARAVCDALTGICYRDDRQVTAIAVERIWAKDGEGPGADITMCQCPAQGKWVYSHPSL